MTEEPARSDAPTARIKKLLGPNFLFRWQIPGEHGTAQTPANNIGLRLRMRTCENAGAIRLRGEQHQTFEDTLP